MLFSKRLFLERYQDLHERIIPNYIHTFGDKDMRSSVQNMNPIIWIYWHFIRTEDVGINRFIRNTPQLNVRFGPLMNADTTLNGTGMDKNEVIGMADGLSLNELKEYHLAVYQNTLLLLDELELELLSETNSNEYIKKVICEEKTMPESTWDLVELYYGKTKEWFLLHVCLTHPFYHLGQISIIHQMES